MHVRVDTGYEDFDEDFDENFDEDLLLGYDGYVKLELERFKLTMSKWSIGEAAGECVLLKAAMVGVELSQEEFP